MAGTARKSVRVLCFGDSLTSGYFSWGMGSSPYSNTLKSRLTAKFPDVDFTIGTDGVPGDVASLERFYQRFRRNCKFFLSFSFYQANTNSRTVNGGKTWDWVIILGGTNDIGMRIPVDEIYSGLRSTWDLSLSKGSKVLALTVPETHAKGPSVDERAVLNAKIQKHRANNFFTLDLESRIPYHSLTDSERDEYWDDGVHLTEEGYDWMGGHIADAMEDLIADNPPADPSATGPSGKPSARGPRPTDEVVWEEEEGNPKHLNQGYVVVRKKDLD